MELRSLEYFLAVAREGSISNAAKSLHITQPTLSRQLAALEQELGRQLYTRNYRGVQLTEEGAVLRRYAESIVDLAVRAEDAISPPAKTVSGTVHIGAGETYSMGLVARAMSNMRKKYPAVDFKLYSGSSADLMDNMVRGLYDMLLECDLQPHENMNVLEMPWEDRWGVLTRADNRLAKLSGVRAEDLADEPLIVSRQATRVGVLKRWFGDVADRLNVVAEYNLPLNARFLVREGVGSAVMYDGLFPTPADGEVTFVPLEPETVSKSGLIWRKTLPTRQAQKLLDEISALVSAERDRNANRNASGRYSIATAMDPHAS